ncbi:MAG: TlpA family protein disulfide reductase [Bacteroidales bacterium]|nr:TlpA family protein disulfide reductase [Bacteroidales bacterium]
MKKLLLIGLLLLGGCVAEEPAEEKVTVGDALPQFSVQLSDGGVFDTATLGGRPSLIIFFNTTCPDCQRTLPEVQKVYETYKSELTFVAISREEPEADVAAWWKAHGITLPYSAQTSRAVYNLFATSRIPRIYIADGKGIVRAAYHDNPCPDSAELDKSVQKLLYR